MKTQLESLPIPPIKYNYTLIIFTFLLFVIAAFAEIGGGYLVWNWLKEKKAITFGLIGGFILFLYGIVPTFQPFNFGRVYAVYDEIFVAMTIIWGLWIDKKRPIRYEIICGFIVLLGALIIFYFPR